MASINLVVNTRSRGEKSVKNLSKDFHNLRQELTRTSRELRDFTAISGDLKTIGADFVKVGAGLSLAFAAPVKAASDFEKTFSGVRALIQSSFDDSSELEKAFNSLSNEAKRLGETTQFTASQAGEAIQFLARAGFETDEILNSLQGTLNLAAVENLDLAQTADIASNVLTGFGLEVEKFGELVDALAGVSGKANVNLVQLGEALKSAAPVAQSAGIEFNEVVAAVGTLGNAGIQGTLAGTSLRAILRGLFQDSGEAAEELEKLGITIENESGNFVGLANVVDQFSNALEGMSDIEKTVKLNRIFGERGGPGFIGLLSQGSNVIRDLEKRSRNQGEAAKRAAIQIDNLQGSFTKLFSAVEGFAIKIGTPFLKPLSEAVDGITDFVGELSEAFDDLGDLGPVIVGTTGAIGGLTVATGALTFSLGTLGFALTSTSKLMTAMTVTAPRLAVAIRGISFAASRAIPILGAFTTGLAIGGVVREWELFGITVDEAVQSGIISLKKFSAEAVLLFAETRKAALNFLGISTAIEDGAIKAITKEIKVLEEVEKQLKRDIQVRQEKIKVQKESSEITDKANKEIQKEAKLEIQRLDGIKKRQAEELQKRRIQQQKIQKINDLQLDLSIEVLRTEIQEIQKASNESLENLEDFFNKRRELIRLEQKRTIDQIVGNNDLSDQEIKLQTQIASQDFKRQIIQLQQERFDAEDEFEEKQLNSIKIISEARNKLSESIHKKELDNIVKRQEKELESLRINGGSSSQIKKLQEIQEKERQEVVKKFQAEEIESKSELEEEISRIKIRAIESVFERERQEFDLEQRRQRKEFEKLLDEKGGLTEREKQSRLSALDQVLAKERKIFNERIANEENFQNIQRQIELQTITVGDAGIEDDSFFGLEQQKERNRLELLELQAQNERKLALLREFGVKEDAIEQARLSLSRQREQRRVDLARETESTKIELVQAFVGQSIAIADTLLAATKGQSKELFAISKGLAIAEATLNIARAISNSIGATGFFGSAQAIQAGVLAGAQLAKVVATSLNFNDGGIVPGPRVNRDIVPANLTPGEGVLNRDAVDVIGENTVNALNAGDFSALAGAPDIAGNINSVANRSFASSQPSVGKSSRIPLQRSNQSDSGQNVTIVNVTSKEELESFMNSTSADNIQINRMRSNPSKFRQALGIK